MIVECIKCGEVKSLGGRCYLCESVERLKRLRDA